MKEIARYKMNKNTRKSTRKSSIERIEEIRKLRDLDDRKFSKKVQLVLESYERLKKR